MRISPMMRFAAAASHPKSTGSADSKAQAKPVETPHQQQTTPASGPRPSNKLPFPTHLLTDQGKLRMDELEDL